MNSYLSFALATHWTVWAQYGTVWAQKKTRQIEKHTADQLHTDHSSQPGTHGALQASSDPNPTIVCVCV